MTQAAVTTNAYVNPHRQGHLRQITEVAANDSDKTITVPAGKWWKVHLVYASLAATAAAGNRQMDLVVGDGSNTFGVSSATAVQIANATEYYYWNPRINTPNETVATQHHLVLPLTVFPPGYTLRIYDSAAIAATTDDLTIRLVVTEYSAE